MFFNTWSRMIDGEVWGVIFLLPQFFRLCAFQIPPLQTTCVKGRVHGGSVKQAVGVVLFLSSSSFFFLSDLRVPACFHDFFHFPTVFPLVFLV